VNLLPPQPARLQGPLRRQIKPRPAVPLPNRQSPQLRWPLRQRRHHLHPRLAPRLRRGLPLSDPPRVRQRRLLPEPGRRNRAGDPAMDAFTLVNHEVFPIQVQIENVAVSGDADAGNTPALPSDDTNLRNWRFRPDAYARDAWVGGPRWNDAAGSRWIRRRTDGTASLVRRCRLTRRVSRPRLASLELWAGTMSMWSPLPATAAGLL
jgi:hypothetical protein